MTSPRLARVALPAVLLAGGLSLTACGAAKPGTAAVVGDERISTTTLQQAADQLAAAGATPETTLRVLVYGHFTVKEAAQMGQGVSTDEARQYAVKNLHIKDPNAATVEVLRRSLATQFVSQSQKATKQFVKDLHSTDITINPRYGHFDAKTGNIQQQAPDWIKTSGSSPSGSGSPSGQ